MSLSVVNLTRFENRNGELIVNKNHKESVTLSDGLISFKMFLGSTDQTSLLVAQNAKFAKLIPKNIKLNCMTGSLNQICLGFTNILWLFDQFLKQKNDGFKFTALAEDFLSNIRFDFDSNLINFSLL